MKVSIVTSWDERCGIAAYAENLVINCEGIDFNIITRQTPVNVAIDSIKNSDLFLLNYEPGILGHWNKDVIRACSKPSILILHTSHDGDNRSEFTDVFTRVVVHEKVQNHGNFVNIPMGIPVVDSTIEDGMFRFDVGTVGFPFPWKGFTQVVQACKVLNMSCLVIIPESRHADSGIMKAHLKEIYNKAYVLTDWLSQNETLKMLNQCSITAFPYHGGNYGISGACRLGLATGKPIVLSRCRQFRDLFEYEDEIQFIAQPPDVDDLVNCFKYLPLSNKKPKRVLEDFNWKIVAEKYCRLFYEIV